jgi:hypothetical protein
MPPAAEPQPKPKRSWRVRALLLPLIVVAATIFYAAWVDQTLPLRHWLFFLHAKYWVFVALFVLSSATAGWRLLGLLVDEPPVLGERFMLALGLGVLAFVLGFFVGGLIGVLGVVFFFAWPAALLAFGGPVAWRDARRAWPRLRRFGTRLYLPRTPVEVLAAVLVLGSLLAIYLQVITPSNLAADAHWYHLPIAEHYAAAGKIRPFAEGWYLGAFPQLASLLYTWAFLSPGRFFDHVALASHIEFVLFVFTLTGIASLTRRLLRGVRAPYAGAALFLFPALYLYDSSLNTGADHVLAFWTPLLGLALVRMGRRFGVKEAALSACMLSGALLTKHQGIYFIPAVGLLLLILCAQRRTVRPLLVFCAVCLVATAPHWLKNWVFYGDPEYPTLHHIFKVHPFHALAGPNADHAFFEPQFIVHGTAIEKIGQVLVSLVNFGLVPHDWGFHRDRPVVGALFTLLLPLLLLLRPSRRLVLTVIGVHIGIAVWFAIKHQDRYLQVLMPWIAACTAAMLALGWRQGWIARGTLAALVGLQIVWGADVYFIRSHAMIGDSFLKTTVDFLSAGHDGRYRERLRHPGSLEEIAPHIPAGAKLLQHEMQEKLGLGAQAICDEPEWQGEYEYLILDVPSEIERHWRADGATHVLWQPNKGGPWTIDKLAREAVFHHTVEPWVDTVPREDVAGMRLIKIPPPGTIPLDSSPTRMAWLGCGGGPPSGLYSSQGLAEGKPLGDIAPAALRASPEATLAPAHAVIYRTTCGEWSGTTPLLIRSGFRHRFQAGEDEIWVRSRNPGR